MDTATEPLNTTISEAVATSPLFRLPPELRNMIYRHSLVDETLCVEVDLTQNLEPGLLSTCRAVRKEALGIFYHENVFFVTTLDCNSDSDYKFKQRVRRNQQREGWKLGGVKCLVETVTDNPSWLDLKVWARRVFEGTVVNDSLNTYTAPARLDLGLQLMKTTFEVLVRERDAGAEWKLVEELVDLLYEVFVLVDPRWKV